eukprot:3982300-Prymnesium_polylepis.1
MSTIELSLHSAQRVGWVSPMLPNDGRRLPHSHFMCAMSTIELSLHSAQRVGRVSPTLPNDGQ